MTTTPTLDAYAPFVGAATIEEIRLLGERLKGRRVQNINSTAVGGGVAEILNRLIPLLHEVGVDARWDVIRGDDAFFAVTKNIHNALHGQPVTLSEHDIEVFRRTTEENLRALELCDDIVFIHDPQPVGLIEHPSPAPTGSGAATSTCRRPSRRCGSSCADGWSATTRRSSPRPSSRAPCRSPRC